MPYIVIYRNRRGRELTHDEITPSFIVQIKRLIPKYMAIEKADMLLNNLKYLEGTLKGVYRVRGEGPYKSEPRRLPGIFPLSPYKPALAGKNAIQTRPDILIFRTRFWDI